MMSVDAPPMPPRSELAPERRKCFESERAPVATCALTPDWVRGGQIPCLDGLRGIAVLMVVLGHAFHTEGAPHWRLLMYVRGTIGVDVFFVISGFLITSLLLREIHRDGKIDLKRFYLRRCLRIMPAYFTLLLTVAICQRCGYFQLESRDWIASLTYTTNFYYLPSWELAHTWSLSIEEHFYVVWPFVLCLGGISAGWRAGIGCVVGCWLIRCGIALGLSPGGFFAESRSLEPSYDALMADLWTFTRLDTIAIGSLMALGCHSDQVFERLNRLTSPELLPRYLFLLCVSSMLKEVFAYQLCLGYTVNAVCIAMLMWGAIRSTGFVRRILENRCLTMIGIGSYSIYLWQQLFLHPAHPGWIHQFPQNIGFVLVAASLSFWLIETPINQLKHRIAR